MKLLQEQLDIIEELKTLCENKEWSYPEGSTRDPLDFGIHSKAEVIKSWHIPKTTGQFLFFMVNLIQPKNILELGTSVGYSALWMGIAAQNYGGNIHTVEYFDEKIEIADSFIKKAELEKTIVVYKNKIIDFLDTTDGEYDFVFMDADKGNYLKYYDLLKQKGSQNCLILVDNAGNFKHRMKDFIDEVQKDDSASVSFLNMDNGILLIQFGRINSNLSVVQNLFKNYQKPE